MIVRFFGGDPALARAFTRFFAYLMLLRCGFLSAVLIPFFTKWGHINELQLQLVQAWFMLCVLILQIPTGAFADRFGRKWSLALGAGLISLGACMYPLWAKFEYFFFCESIFAFGWALTSGADKAYMYEVLVGLGRTDAKQLIFGRAHQIGLVGMMLGAPIGGWLSLRYGLAAPMLCSSVPFLAAGLVALSLAEPDRKSQDRPSYLETASRGASYLHQHTTLKILAIDSTLVATAAYFVIWTYQRLLTKVHVPDWEFGYHHAAFVAIQMVIAAQFARMIPSGQSTRTYLLFGALATAGSYWLVSVHLSYLTIWLFIGLAGGFGLTRLELMLAHMNSHIPDTERATVLSTISMVRQLTIVCANPAFGYVAQHVSLSWGLAVLGCLPILALFLAPLENHMFESDAVH